MVRNEPMSKVLECTRPVQDDAPARRILQSALGAFQKWPEGFVGFAAAVRCSDGAEAMTGAARVFAGGAVEIALDHPALRLWAEAALRALAQARTPHFFKDADGRFPIMFDPGDGRPGARRIRVDHGGGVWRAYRIDTKGRVCEQEHAEPGRRETVSYDELIRTSPGRVIPTRMRRLDWHVTTQTPIEAADVEDVYSRINDVVLPVRRRATVVRGGTTRVLTLELDRHAALS